MRTNPTPNQFQRPLHLIRRALGFTLLILGILGAIFPVIPGWPALVPAILLLGRRDRTLRLLHLLVRRTLREARRARAPQLRQAGRWASGQYLGMRRSLTPHLIRAERALGW